MKKTTSKIIAEFKYFLMAATPIALYVYFVAKSVKPL